MVQYGHWYRFRPCVWMVPVEGRVRGHTTRLAAQGIARTRRPERVDATLFQPRPRAQMRAELGLRDGPLRVGWPPQRLERGCTTPSRALAALGADAPEARLVIVGAGEQHARLEQLSRSLGVGQRVHFVGGQPHEIVAKYLAAADVFLFPTERGEAAPRAPQAMACAVPVIASDIGGIPEVVQRSGSSGILVPPGDVHQLAQAMRTLVRDESLRRRLGEAARRRVLVEYTVERMVEETLSVYRVGIARLRQ